MAKWLSGWKKLLTSSIIPDCQIPANYKKMKYSIIIPTLNAQDFIERCINSIQLANVDCEIIVVDGGSSDQTLQLLEGKEVVIVRADKGRGIQLNEGARKAAGEILIFLHADTMLPGEAFKVIEKHFKLKHYEIGKCCLKFDKKDWLLSFYSRIARVDSIWTSFGDQVIVVKKEFFDKVGGFPDWPLLEDVAFFQKARKVTKVYTLPVEIVTSAQRFVKNGIVRQQLFNAWIILQYLCGVSPWELAVKYENKK